MPRKGHAMAAAPTCLVGRRRRARLREARLAIEVARLDKRQQTPYNAGSSRSPSKGNYRMNAAEKIEISRAALRAAAEGFAAMPDAELTGQDVADILRRGADDMLAELERVGIATR